MKKQLAIILALLMMSACSEPLTAVSPAASVPQIGQVQQEQRLPPSGYSKSLLSNAQQVVYDQLYNCVAAYKIDTEVALGAPMKEDLFTAVWNSLNNDYPAFYWAECSYVYREGGIVTSFILQITPPLSLSQVKERQLEIDRIADQLLDGIEGTDFEVVVAVHDALLRRLSYSRGSPTNDAGNIYGGLVAGEGVCDAYSKSLQYLLSRKGITCCYISGVSIRNVPHSWNAVLLDDGWYYIDATWNDVPNQKGYLFHDYLLITSEEMAVEHLADQKQYPLLPEAMQDTFNYYRALGYCADMTTADPPIEAMAAGFVKQLEDASLSANKKPVFLEIKLLGAYQDYEQWRTRFTKEIFDLLRAIDRQLEAQGLPIDIDTTGSIDFNFNDNTQVLTLFPNAAHTMPH